MKNGQDLQDFSGFNMILIILKILKNPVNPVYFRRSRSCRGRRPETMKTAWVRTLPACWTSANGPMEKTRHAGSVRTQAIS
jgi:hypothetical protein